MSDNNDKIPIKVGFTNHTFSNISPTDKSVIINLEIYFIYNEKEVLDNFKISPDNKNEFKFPFFIQNALEIKTQDLCVTYADCGDIKNNNINYHKTKGILNNNETCNKKTFCRLEKHSIICELKIINFVELIPFNSILIPIKIITNGCQGCENIKFIPESGCEIMWGVQVKSTKFGNRWLPDGYILSTDIQTGNITNYEDMDTSYSRIYFILGYKFGVLMDIIKYYYIPTVLTIILSVFYHLEENDFVGLFSTIILGDIALLFILPTTGTITRSEKSVCLNILLVFILIIFKINEIELTRLTGILIFSLINLCNLIYDIIDAKKIHQKINKLIKYDTPINNQTMGDLSKKIDTLHYVISESSESINTNYIALNN
jgi:hypothetical protein